MSNTSFKHYFDLFNLPIAFDVNQEKLKAQFLALQKQYHPDQTAQSNPISDIINSAYQTLSKDDARAVYLLEVLGHVVNLDKTLDDKTFLTDMMQLRIELEEAKENNDMDAIYSVKQNSFKYLTAQKQLFNDAFCKKDWHACEQSALKLKFIANVYDACQCNIQNSNDDWFA